jgi:tRNA-Thr(GGU) m(6)t(6)A37 methyltransferase TsaA
MEVTMDIVFHPIGYIRSPYKEIKETPKWGTESGATEAEIVLDDQFLEGIADIKPGERYQLVFYFHETNGYSLTVKKRGTDIPAGVFSTRSPHRPNAIGISVITVKEIQGNHIRFTGVDMLDNTPVLDIKSYDGTS